MGDCMSLSFFPELYPGGKRERGGTTVERQPQHKDQTENSLERRKKQEILFLRDLRSVIFTFVSFLLSILRTDTCPVVYVWAFTATIEVPDLRLWALVWRCRLELAV